MTEYRALAVSLAVYPREHAITYPIMGLCGETIEMLQSHFSEDECGDVLWYIAVLSHDLDTLPVASAAHNGSFIGPCGKLLEYGKKRLRGDNADHITRIREALNEYWSLYITMFDSTIDRIAENNLQKLFGRRDRGVLKGSGDNR